MIKKYIALINKKNISLFLKTFVPAALLIAFVGLQPFQEPHVFLRDINTRVYFGLVSNIGAFFWMGAAVIALFGYAYADKYEDKKTSRFLRFAAIFSLFLMIDDFFMIHDKVFTVYLEWPEEIIFIGILLGLIYYLYLYLKMNDLFYAPLLVSALGFLCLSMLGDAFGLGYLFEDGTKFIGIALWLSFHWVSTWSLVNEPRKNQ